MKKSLSYAKVRRSGSACGLRRMRLAGRTLKLQKGILLRRCTFSPAGESDSRVFIGPSVEGEDVEYIERVRGKVSDQKPSFERRPNTQWYTISAANQSSFSQN